MPLLVISCNSNPKANETTQVFLGGYHSSLVTQDGNLYFWGRNMYGGLGDGTTVSKSTPIDITSELNLKFRETIIQMSLGTYHSSILTSSGRLFTWGNNAYGQLGDNTTTNRLTPVDISSEFDLSNDEIIIQVSFSGVSSSAITSNGRIFVWGGQTTDIGIIFPVSVPIDITSEFDLNPEEKIIQVSLSDYHSAVITSEGRIFTWGNNDFGQLGDGTTTGGINPIDITSQFSLDEE